MGCGFQTGAGTWFPQCGCLHLHLLTRYKSIAGAVINVAQPSPTSSIAISGLGGVGLSAVLAARSMGIPEDKLFGIDVIESRLKMVSRRAAITATPRAGIASESPLSRPSQWELDTLFKQATMKIRLENC